MDKYNSERKELKKLKEKNLKILISYLILVLKSTFKLSTSWIWYKIAGIGIVFARISRVVNLISKEEEDIVFYVK